MTIDLGVERDYGLLAVDVGYDERGVTGFDADNMLVFGSVKQVTAVVGTGVEFNVLGVAVDLEKGYNIHNSKPRVAVSFKLGPIEVEADYSDDFRNANASWSRGFGDGWGVKAEFRHSAGFNQLPDAFGGRADAPAANYSNDLIFSLTRKI